MKPSPGIFILLDGNVRNKFTLLKEGLQPK